MRKFLNPTKFFISLVYGPFEAYVEKAALPVIFVFLAIAMLFDPGRDTLQISGAAFVTTLALASVTFSYARTLRDGSAIRDEVVFAGEKIVRGAILFLIASILKHASHDVPRYTKIIFIYTNKLLEWRTGSKPSEIYITVFGYDILEILFSLAAFLFFYIGLVSAQKGVILVANITKRRISKRHDSKEDYFVSMEALHRRLAELERIDKEYEASRKV